MAEIKLLDKVSMHSDYVKKMVDKFPPKEVFAKRDSLATKYKRKYKIFAGFKAFNGDMTCKDFKYVEGVLCTYAKPGKVRLCARGFHFCPEPLDVFSYYPMGLDTKVAFVYALVEESIYSGLLERRLKYERYSFDKNLYDNENFSEVIPAKNPEKLCATAIYIAHVLSHEEIVDCINRSDRREINSSGIGPYRPEHIDFYKKGIDDSQCTVCGRYLSWSGLPLTHTPVFSSLYPVRGITYSSWKNGDPDGIRNLEGHPVCARCGRRMARKAREHALADSRKK